MTRTAPAFLAVLVALHCKRVAPLPADAGASQGALPPASARSASSTASLAPSMAAGALPSPSPASSGACAQTHWPEPFRPRQGTEKPRYSTNCSGPSCVRLEPVLETAAGCADKCRPVTIRPRVVAADPERARTLEQLFDAATLESRSDECWLTFLDYTIHHDDDGVLDVSFRASGSGAYPSFQTAHVAVELATLRRIDAGAAFASRSLASLTAGVKQKVLVAFRAAKKAHPEVYEGRDEPVVRREHLENFVVDAEGVTFLFDFGLPHAVASASPVAEYPFTRAEIRRFIAPEGPLGFLVEARP